MLKIIILQMVLAIIFIFAAEVFGWLKGIDDKEMLKTFVSLIVTMAAGIMTTVYKFITEREERLLSKVKTAYYHELDKLMNRINNSTENLHELREKLIYFFEHYSVFKDITNREAEHFLLCAIGAYLKGEGESVVYDLIYKSSQAKGEIPLAPIVEAIFYANDPSNLISAIQLLREIDDPNIYKTALVLMGAKLIPISFDNEKTKFLESQEVYLSGDFNNWFQLKKYSGSDTYFQNMPKTKIDEELYKMHKVNNIWSIELLLPKGDYSFKFYAKPNFWEGYNDSHEELFGKGKLTKGSDEEDLVLHVEQYLKKINQNFAFDLVAPSLDWEPDAKFKFLWKLLERPGIEP